MLQNEVQCCVSSVLHAKYSFLGRLLASDTGQELAGGLWIQRLLSWRPTSERLFFSFFACAFSMMHCFAFTVSASLK